MATPRSILALLALSLACSSGTPASPDAEPPVPAPFELRWGPLVAQPGEEDVRCVVVRLGNDEPVAIKQIHNVLGDASHHLIVYRTPDTEEQLEPQPCETLQNLLDPAFGVPLMITQKHEETLSLPPGVGFTFEPGQMLRLELHYINASDQPLELEVTSTLTPMAASELEHVADFLFVGNPDIEIPPGQSATLGPTYIPMYAELFGASFFGFTGHQHQWGTNVTVSIAPGPDGPDTAVYEIPDFNWSEPETKYHDPPMVMPEGGGFRFTCDWTNLGPTTARFGEEFNDEMCFFWAYYYPSTEVKTCFHTDQTGAPLDVCCPGSPLCGLIDDFINR